MHVGTGYCFDMGIVEKNKRIDKLFLAFNYKYQKITFFSLYDCLVFKNTFRVFRMEKTDNTNTITFFIKPMEVNKYENK